MNRIFVSLITATASAELLLESTAIAGTPADARFAELEAPTKSRVGVAAIDLSTNRRVDYRMDERFIMCSTFKVLAVAAMTERR